MAYTTLPKIACCKLDEDRSQVHDIALADFEDPGELQATVTLAVQSKYKKGTDNLTT